MMQAAGVPLERCANSYRAALPPGAAPPPGPAGGVGAPAPPCDMNKKWLTDEEYATRMEALRTRVDASRQFAEQGNLGRAMMTGLTDPNIPQRQTNLIVEPGERAAAAADAGGQAPRGAREERLGAAGRDDRVRRARRASIAGTAASRAACRRR